MCLWTGKNGLNMSEKRKLTNKNTQIAQDGNGWSKRLVVDAGILDDTGPRDRHDIEGRMKLFRNKQP